MATNERMRILHRELKEYLATRAVTPEKRRNLKNGSARVSPCMRILGTSTRKMVPLLIIWPLSGRWTNCVEQALN